MSTSKIIGLTAIAALGVVRAAAQPTNSTDDLWDVSRGVVITGQSPMNQCNTKTAFDARNIFGGNFPSMAASNPYNPSAACKQEAPGTATFIDWQADGFIHYVEWAAPNPVTIRSFGLWAAGDGAAAHNAREMTAFRLLAKSEGSSTFDLLLYTFTPTHPYTFVDGIYGLLILTDIKPTTARQFRAEFVNRAIGPGVWPDGPRIIELDGFGNFIGPTAGIRISEAEVSWQSALGLKYVVEFREDLPGSNWIALGSVVGDGTIMRFTDKIPPGAGKRFYRVRAVE